MTHLLLLLFGVGVYVWSGINPTGRFNWIAETFPAVIGAIVILATYRRFKLSTLSYTLILIFSCILMIGGKYTYANVPIGNWVRDQFHLSRNHFDRLGHFFQGVIPAMVVRELLLRTTKMQRGKMLFFLCLCVASAISAYYELFEWRYAVRFGGQAADDFLGSQGDIWDAQKDMLMATIGAIVSQAILSRLQDRQIAALAPANAVEPAVAVR